MKSILSIDGVALLFAKKIAIHYKSIFILAIAVVMACECMVVIAKAYAQGPSRGAILKYDACIKEDIPEADCKKKFFSYETSKMEPKPVKDLVGDPKKSPPAGDQIPPPSTAHADANAAAVAAAKEEAEREAMYARDAERAKKNREDEIKDAEARARANEARAAETRRAEIRAAAEQDRRLVERFKEKLKREQEISLAEARKAKDEEIRKKLILASLDRAAQKEFEQEKKKSELKVAELLKMAAVTMQAATAMNSVDQSQPLLTANSAPSTKAKPGLSNRSPASLGDQADISEKSTDDLSADADSDTDATAKAEKNQQTKAQIKEAIEAAEKRKAILALRLKNKLRDKDKLAKGEKQEGLDTSELFGGSLTSQLAKEAEAEAHSSSSIPEDVSFTSSVFSAVKGGFSLAGAETDREVKEIVDGVQRELSSEEMSSGVLAEDSQSLFERVHAAHRSCLRQKCVFSVTAPSSR